MAHDGGRRERSGEIGAGKAPAEGRRRGGTRLARALSFPMAAALLLAVGLSGLSPWMIGAGRGDGPVLRVAEPERAVALASPGMQGDDVVAAPREKAGRWFVARLGTGRDLLTIFRPVLERLDPRGTLTCLVRGGPDGSVRSAVCEERRA